MSVLDMKMLGLLRVLESADEPDILGCLIETYLVDSSGVLMGMRRAVADGDTEAFKWMAHRLKGSSGVFGAETLTHLCDEVSILAAPLPTPEARRWLTQIEIEYARVTVALQAEQSRH